MKTTTKKLTMPLGRFRAWIEQVVPFASPDTDLTTIATVHLRSGRADGKRWVVAEATDRYVYGAHRLEVGGDGPTAALLSTGDLEATISAKHVRLILAAIRPALARDGGNRAMVELAFVHRDQDPAAKLAAATSGVHVAPDGELFVKATGPLRGGIERLEMTIPLVIGGYPDMAALVGRTWALAEMAPVIVTGVSSGLARFAAVRPLDGEPHLTMWGGRLEGQERDDRAVMVTVGPNFVGMFTQMTTGSGARREVPDLDAWGDLLTRPAVTS